MSSENAQLSQRIEEGRESVAVMGGALVDYLAAVQRVTDSSSEAAERYEAMIAIADIPLSAEVGEKFRESVAQFANGSLAMATAFSQIMRTMKDAYDRIEAGADTM